MEGTKTLLQQIIFDELRTYRDYIHNGCGGKLKVTGFYNLMCKGCNKIIGKRDELRLV